QFLAGQPDQPLEIALPQLLRGRRVPVAQLAEPLAHRLIRRHRPGPPTGKTGKRDQQRLYCLALRLRKAQADQVTTIPAVLRRVGVPGQVPARRGGSWVALHIAWVETQAGAPGLLELFPNGLFTSALKGVRPPIPGAVSVAQLEGWPTGATCCRRARSN